MYREFAPPGKPVPDPVHGGGIFTPSSPVWFELQIPKHPLLKYESHDKKLQEQFISIRFILFMVHPDDSSSSSFEQDGNVHLPSFEMRGLMMLERTFPYMFPRKCPVRTMCWPEQFFSCHVRDKNERGLNNFDMSIRKIRVILKNLKIKKCCCCNCS